jgi:hypothetical protein
MAPQPAHAASQARFRQRMEAAIARDDPRELVDVALEIALEARDQGWAQSCCTQLARHRDALVRGSALVGFGHLARRFGQLDPHRVKRIVENGLWDRNEHVRGQAQIAAEDLTTYLCWDFERPPQ